MITEISSPAAGTAAVGDIVLVTIGYTDRRFVIESTNGGLAGRRLFDSGSLGEWENLSHRPLVILGRYEPPPAKPRWWEGIVRILDAIP